VLINTYLLLAFFLSLLEYPLVIWCGVLLTCEIEKKVQKGAKSSERDFIDAFVLV
jgi:hypothetical protein